MGPSAAWRALARQDAVWAFDVDGTLVGSVRSDVLRPGAAALLERLTRCGVICVLWSAGGQDYAQRMAIAHGIHPMVTACYAKQRSTGRLGYGVDHFALTHRPHVFVDDAPDDLPHDATVIAVPQFIGSNLADRALWAVLDQLPTQAEPR